MTVPAPIENNVANRFLLAPSSADPSALLSSLSGAMILDIESAPWDRDPGLQDSPTQTSGGFNQSVPTVKKWSGTVSGVVRGTNYLALVEGSVYAASGIQFPGNAIYGYVRIGKIHEDYVGPKGYQKWTFDFVNEGPYATAAATAN